MYETTRMMRNDEKDRTGEWDRWIVQFVRMGRMFNENCIAGEYTDR